MSYIGETGEVSVNTEEKEFDVEWKMDFLHLSGEDGVWYCSPTFSFKGESWWMRIYPNGSKVNDSLRYINLSLQQFSSGLPINAKVSFALRKKVLEEHCTVIFEEGSRIHGIKKLISISDFDRRQSEYLASGFLTVVCSLKMLDSTGSASNIATADCSYCKKSFDAQEISSHEKKCRIKCPECSDVILLQNWNDHECQISRAEGFESLSQDFQKMLLDGCDHDLILKIDEREFRAHKDVLRARSRVFKSMLSHDMVEKNSSVIDVPDCDPQAMEQFLLYVYSGKVEATDKSSMNGLYYIADKYEMKDLKEACSKFLKQSLSISNFCDVIQVALKHSDSSLLEFATEYFISNVLDIMRTVEWQTFMKDNLTVANELIIKSHEKKK